jgi:hypothetical protein
MINRSPTEVSHVFQRKLDARGAALSLTDDVHRQRRLLRDRQYRAVDQFGAFRAASSH